MTARYVQSTFNLYKLLLLIHYKTKAIKPKAIKIQQKTVLIFK